MPKADGCRRSRVSNAGTKGPSPRSSGMEQQLQQDVGHLKRDHAARLRMIAGVVAVAAQDHDPEGSGHRALAWGQYSADQQHLHFQPGRTVLEQRCERNKNGYNCVRQGKLA